MIVGDPDVRYRQFTAHVASCGVCHGAGGERAAEGALCAAGRALLMAWGRAEQTWADLDAARARAGADA